MEHEKKQQGRCCRRCLAKKTNRHAPCVSWTILKVLELHYSSPPRQHFTVAGTCEFNQRPQAQHGTQRTAEHTKLALVKRKKTPDMHTRTDETNRRGWICPGRDYQSSQMWTEQHSQRCKVIIPFPKSGAVCQHCQTRVCIQ